MPNTDQKQVDTPSGSNRTLLLEDAFIILIMAVLAGCGLIYEYLLSHYAARVLGVVESTIFAMIGFMIVAMGLGSFAAKRLKDAYTAFAWLELCIAFIGMSSVLIIAAIFSFANTLPQLIATTYGLPADLEPSGGVLIYIENFARWSPYIIGFILGFLVGIEIPLIARIREDIYQKSLTHNAGTIYGADYLGAGVGAAIWVLFMLSMEISTAAAATASANFLAGIAFYLRYKNKIKYSQLYLIGNIILCIFLLSMFQKGEQWERGLENTLYKDEVIYSAHSKYQHITITERIMDPSHDPIYTLFINGRTQFTSADEVIYHEMLVHPAMATSARHDDILIIGGGDGLGVREALKWHPKKITLLELDKEIVSFFKDEKFDEERGTIINAPLLSLNKNALSDPRVDIVFDDAFNSVDQLLKQEKKFDTIIVDLPDPSHPDLNKLYSDRFYQKLYHLLQGDGAIVIQSTSPYHAKPAFLSIGKTVKSAEFFHVEQFRQNVPSFGEWGWTIATKNGASPLARLNNLSKFDVETKWVTLPLAKSAFQFPVGYYDDLQTIKPNRIGSHVVYQYHQQAWKDEQGIFSSPIELKSAAQ